MILSIRASHGYSKKEICHFFAYIILEGILISSRKELSMTKNVHISYCNNFVFKKTYAGNDDGSKFVLKFQLKQLQGISIKK